MAGGGSTLIQLAGSLDGLANQLHGDQRTGVEIVHRALSAPLRQIAINAGANGDVVVEQVQRSAEVIGSLSKLKRMAPQWQLPRYCSFFPTCESST